MKHEDWTVILKQPSARKGTRRQVQLQAELAVFQETAFLVVTQIAPCDARAVHGNKVGNADISYKGRQIERYRSDLPFI